MEAHRRGAGGRRLFTAQFKQEQLARVADARGAGPRALGLAVRGPALAPAEHGRQLGGGQGGRGRGAG